MCFFRRKARAEITAGTNEVGANANVVVTNALMATFANFHQLILWEIASFLPIETLHNLLKAFKGHKQFKDILMLVINSHMIPIITKLNLVDTRYCLTRFRITRPLLAQNEIDLVRTNLREYFSTFDKTCYSDKKIMDMLDYLEIDPPKEEQMRASHVLLGYYCIAFGSKDNDILPRFDFWYYENIYNTRNY
jgi:hypothetical protein